MTAADIGETGACSIEDRAPDLLEIRNIKKAFAGKPVLAGISMAVQNREVVFVIGPSGSGKSTLLRCVNRLEKPDSGTILLEGKEVAPRGAELNRLRQDIGFVFQSFNLYPHLNALGNVALALRVVRRMRRGEAYEAAIGALREVGLDDKLNAYPAELSGGQQQRVAIARALVLEPKIMLFDEPTSALDPEIAGEVRNVMLRVRNRGMTMIIVSHEMGFAREIADRVVFIDQGKVVETGSPATFFANPKEARTRAFLGKITA